MYPEINQAHTMMEKKLILVRHAKSLWLPNERKFFMGDDRQRPLNKRGKTAAGAIASYLKSTANSVDKIFSSDALRAVQTFQKIILRVDTNYENAIDPQLYTFAPKELLAYIKKLKNHLKTVMIIGHNPAIQEVCTHLIVPENSNPFYAKMKKKYPTGGIATINFSVSKWDELSKSSGKLKNFSTPKSIVTKEIN